MSLAAQAFEAALEHEADRRQRRLLEDLATQRLPRWPSSPGPLEGFMPQHRAAEAMGLTERQLGDLVARGLLEVRSVGSSLLVRPAIVSVLGVADERADDDVV